MTRGPCGLNTRLKKGPWSAKEDEILVDHINKHGHSNWRALPKQAGLLRCGKSCRLRWTNYLNPNIKRGNFSREEEETIIELHRVLGNRWSAIAARLPGRTDNEIKNVWHTHLKKRLQYDTTRPTQTRVTKNVSIEQSNSVSSSNESVDDMKVYVAKEEFMEYSEEYKPEIDESFWSDESDLMTMSDRSNATFQCQTSFEVNSLRDFRSSIAEDELEEFWRNILVEANGLITELPEF